MNDSHMMRGGPMMMPGGQIMGAQAGPPYPGGPQVMPQHMISNQQQMGYSASYGGQRMPPYMAQQMQGGGGGGQMQMHGAGQIRGGQMATGPMRMGMGMNMNMPMNHQQMMQARGARPPMNLPTGARPMMQQGMYQGNNMMGQAGQQWNNSGYNSPQQYVQSPYHSPQMPGGASAAPGGPMQRFPSGGPPPQAGPPQRPIGNPKQALQDMLRARHTDPQFSANSNFMPPGRTSFPMRPSMARMPTQSAMYGSNSSSGNQPGGQQFMGNSGNNSQYGNFQGQGQGQGQNQYAYNMMQGQQRPPGYGQMAMRPQGGQPQQYPMRGPGPAGYIQGQVQGGYRAQMQSGGMNQQNMMRMQNPQLMAQLQRGPAGNMNQQQQQSMGGYGGPPPPPQQQQQN